MSESPRTPRLLDQVKERIRLRRYSPRTEAAYVHWIKRYILFSQKRHPAQMGRREVETFLSHLAQVEHVSPSTQNQALSAILFLYKDVLEMPLDQSINAARAKRGKHLPTVLSIDEVRRLLAAMQGTPQLIAQLLYGSGLRVEECLTLRVHQLDFANGWIMVIGGKGSKDGVTMLPKSLGPALEQHLIRVAHLHQQDLERGLGAVILPHAYHVKHPGASHDFKW